MLLAILVEATMQSKRETKRRNIKAQQRHRGSPSYGVVRTASTVPTEQTADTQGLAAKQHLLHRLKWAFERNSLASTNE